MRANGEKMNPFSICGYARISVDLDEGRDNTSIENQITIIKEYVQNCFPGSSLDLYVDRDRSGYTFSQREQYQIMRRRMLAHQYDILIVKDLSRFSRRNGQGLVELEFLRDLGIRIIAIGDNIDYPTNDDWIRIQIYFLMNEMPVVDASKKVRHVIQRRQQDGKWITAVPYGYYLTDTKAMAFTIDPTEADVVRTIFRLYNDGWGYKRIANWLTAQHYPTPRRDEIARIEARGGSTVMRAQDAWSTVTVQGILDNDFYVGTLRQGKYTRGKINGADIKRDEKDHVVFQNHHEAIIDACTFAITQELRKIRKRSNYRGFRKNNSPYRGLLTCGDCGSPMFFMSRSDLPPAYRCGAYHRRGLAACTSHHIRVETLDEIVREYLRRVLNDAEDLLADLRLTESRTVDQQSPSASRALELKLHTLQSDLKAITIQKARDQQRYPEKADVIDETYDAIEMDLINQIEGVKNHLSSLEGRKADNSCRPESASAAGLLERIINGTSIGEDVLRTVLSRVYVYEDHVEVQFKADFGALLKK